MPEFIMFMHSDSASDEYDSDWEAYINMLNASGQFRGGSSIGNGLSYRNTRPTCAAPQDINGFIRLEAPDMDSARALLDGNPTLLAGGTVEIRELIES